MPACVALDRLRPVNAAEALICQAEEQDSLMQQSQPLNPITEEEEEPPQELEDMSDDDTPQLEDKPSYQRRARVQTDVTVDEPDMEVVPPSRRRSRQEQENDQADVPMSFRRSFSSREPQEHVPVVDSAPSESRASNEPSPLREMFQRSGTTGPGVEPAEDVWNRTHFAGGWQVHEETGVVVRIHDTPTALLNPESTGDCPIPKERLSGVRVTSLTGKDGSTQTIQGSWEDGQDKEFQNRIDREDCVHSD